MYRIKIKYNSSEEMMSIEDNKEDCLFYGNYWDFERTPQGLFKFLNQFMEVDLDDSLPSMDE